MINRIRKFVFDNNYLKNGVLFSLFSIINSGINFILLLLLSKYLLPEQYGYLNLFVTLLSIFGVLIAFNVKGFVATQYFKSEFSETKKIINTEFLFAIVSFILILLILYIGRVFFEGIAGLGFEYIFVALCICLMQVFINMTLEIWRLNENIRKYGLFSCFYTFFNLLLTIILVLCFNKGWLGRVDALLSVTILFFLISLFVLYTNGLINLSFPSKEQILRSLNFGLPLIPHSISWWLRQGLDRYILNYFYSHSVVGCFSLSYNFANILQIISVGFNSSYSVNIYKLLSTNSDKSADKILRQNLNMSFIYLLISIGTIILSYLFIPVFLPQYLLSLRFVIPLCVGAFFQSVYYLFVNILFFYRKTRQLMMITFSISILHVCLSLFLSRFDYVYCAYVSLFSNMLITIIVVWYVNKIYPLPWRAIKWRKN